MTHPWATPLASLHLCPRRGLPAHVSESEDLPGSLGKYNTPMATVDDSRWRLYLPYRSLAHLFLFYFHLQIASVRLCSIQVVQGCFSWGCLATEDVSYTLFGIQTG